MKWERAGLAGLFAVVLFTAGCTATHPSAPHSAPTTTSAPSGAQACPVTEPTQGAVPAGIAVQKPGPVYNQGDLWVRAWWDNPEALAAAGKKMTGGIGGDAKYPYGMKYPTWKVLAGKLTGEGSRPRISVKPLDGHGHGSGILGGYTNALQDDGNTAYWWPTVVGFTTHGCWQVTETQGGDSLAYIIKL